MKGPAPSIRDSDDVTVPEVKVKRKCGRPRNPIPRHQRPSHIEAEQKRRVKIQEGLQALKSFLPKDYQTPGRESKADILLNSVKYMMDHEEEVRKQRKELEQLRAETAALNADITSFQQNLPDEKLFEENPLSADQRFDRMVSERSKDSDNTVFSIFGYLIKPLHRSFEQMSDCSTIEAFQGSTRAWANRHLSRASLRPMITERLQELSKEKSFLDIPDHKSPDAQQRCRQGRKLKATTPATDTSALAGSACHKRQAVASSSSSGRRGSRGPKIPRLMAGKRGRNSITGRAAVVPSGADGVVPQPDLPLPSSSTSTSTGLLFSDHLEEAVQAGKRRVWSSAAAVKTEELQPKAEFRPSCSVQSVPLPGVPCPAGCLDTATELPKLERSAWEKYQGSPTHLLSKNVADSPLSTDSAISLSPPPSSTYESSLLGGDFLYESSLDQCYEPLTPATPSVCQDFRQGQSNPSPLLDRGDDLEELAGTFDLTIFQSMVDNCHEPPASMNNEPSVLNMGLSASDHMELLSNVDSSLLFGTDLPASSEHADPPCPISTDLPSFVSMIPASSSHVDPPSLMTSDHPSFINMVPSSSSHVDPATSMNTDPPSFINAVPSSSNPLDPPSFVNMVPSSSGSFDSSSLLDASPSTSAAVPRIDHSPALPHDVLQHDFLQHDALHFEPLQFDTWQFDAWPLGEWVG